MKFTVAQREQIKNIVATLSLKRLSDKEIIKEIELLTGNQVSREYIYKVRQLIKKESFKWYTTLRNSHYEYLHEFKERINEIYWLQQKRHEIIKNNEHNPSVQQASLNEQSGILDTEHSRKQQGFLQVTNNSFCNRYYHWDNLV